MNKVAETLNLTIDASGQALLTGADVYGVPFKHLLVSWDAPCIPEDWSSPVVASNPTPYSGRHFVDCADEDDALNTLARIQELKGLWRAHGPAVDLRALQDLRIEGGHLRGHTLSNTGRYMVFAHPVGHWLDGGRHHSMFRNTVINKTYDALGNSPFASIRCKNKETADAVISAIDRLVEKHKADSAIDRLVEKHKADQPSDGVFDLAGCQHVVFPAANEPVLETRKLVKPLADVKPGEMFTANTNDTQPADDSPSRFVVCMVQTNSGAITIDAAGPRKVDISHCTHARILDPVTGKYATEEYEKPDDRVEDVRDMDNGTLVVLDIHPDQVYRKVRNDLLSPIFRTNTRPEGDRRHRGRHVWDNGEITVLGPLYGLPVRARRVEFEYHNPDNK